MSRLVDVSSLRSKEFDEEVPSPSFHSLYGPGIQGREDDSDYSRDLSTSKSEGQEEEQQQEYLNSPTSIDSFLDMGYRTPHLHRPHAIDHSTNVPTPDFLKRYKDQRPSEGRISRTPLDSPRYDDDTSDVSEEMDIHYDKTSDVMELPNPIPKQMQIIPLYVSLAGRYERITQTDGLCLGRSFRVGWGPGGSFVLPRGMISSQFYHINIQRVEITPEQSEESINNHLPMLKAHLTRASVNEDYQNYQLLENVVDEIIKEYLLLNKEPFDDGTGNESKTTLQYNVWSLVKALWGKHQGRFASNIDEYQDTLCRLFSVNQWFKSVCRPLVTREIGSIRDVEEGKRTNLYCIFQHLSCKSVKEAVELALKSCEFELSTLIAQAASGSVIFQDYVRDQLRTWEAQGVILEEEYHPIWAILAGNVEEVCHLVDWKRALAMHLWYGRGLVSLGEALDNYEQSVKIGKARPPSPSYVSSPFDSIDVEELPTCDILYHLLRLSCQPNYQLSKIFEPCTWTEFQLDYRLGWHLYSVLTALNLVPNDDVIGHEITMNYAHELESLGLWEWAIYLILNLPLDQNSNYNQNLVKDVLARNMFVSTQDELLLRDQKLLFVEGLGVPTSWVKYAQAPFEHYHNNYVEEVRCLLLSSQWESAHTVLVQNLVHSILLIHSENLVVPFHVLDPEEEEEEDDGDDTLLTVLARFLVTLFRHRTQLQGWSERGGIFYDYLKIHSLFGKMERHFNHYQQQEEEDLVTDEDTHTELLFLSNNLKGLLLTSIETLKKWHIPVDTDKIKNVQLRVCKDNMSSKLHSMMGRILFVKRVMTPTVHTVAAGDDDDADVTTTTMPSVDVESKLVSLSIPEDQTRKHLTRLTSNFLASLQ
eukprot:TRINITY_DN6773_c0_g2_i7.p1 TRINITY_DN6773_c0_g2~~TRINITY_DN6773_c0_g2_i7.p1  ORF type:complete len:872 (+),score=187.74 TRINITY_DN6773_c0_g2_i7:586-3201(+)